MGPPTQKAIEIFRRNVPILHPPSITAAWRNTGALLPPEALNFDISAVVQTANPLPLWLVLQTPADTPYDAA